MKFLLVLLFVLPDQVVPVAVFPYETKAACEAELAKGVALMKQQKQGAYVGACLPVKQAGMPV